MTPYYSAVAGAAPAFDPGDPTGSGDWTTTPGASVNHLAYLVGTLAAGAAPQNIYVTAVLQEPGSGTLPPAGTQYLNSVTIFTSSTEDDDPDDPTDGPDNNTADFLTRLPGVDLSLTKEGSREGGFPGVAPGQEIDYTFIIRNEGSVTAYGIRLTDTLQTNFTPSSPFAYALTVEVTDENGGTLLLVDEAGDAHPAAVPLTLTGTRRAGR